MRGDLAARWAVEALRSGVPSRTAVAHLGLGQPEVEDRFATLLQTARDPDLPGGGMLLGGGFGAGKSHTLEHLAAVAAGQGFVVSRVVVSKETPLHDPVKLLRAAVDTAAPPAGKGWPAPGTAVGEALPARMRAKELPEWDERAAAAVAGMQALADDLVLLAPPDDEELDSAYAALRDLHARAFGWEPPHVPGLERLQATRMRQHVRAWINEWDLVRLDPRYTPATAAGSLTSRYDEVAELLSDSDGAPAG